MYKKIMLTFYFILSLRAPGGSFEYGEKVSYRAYWNGIRIGTVTMEVVPVANSKDYQFQVEIKTVSLAGKIYSFQQKIVSRVDPGLTRALSYRQENQKGKKPKKSERIDFDWNKKTLTYYKDEKRRGGLPLAKDAFDPLSFFYFFRNQSLAPGVLIRCSLTDGKRIIDGTAAVTKETRLKIKKFGKVPVWYIESDLAGFTGVSTEVKDAKLEMWIVRDATQIPVKMKTKVKYGAFSMELDDYQAGRKKRD
ncbi:MAG: DUF3108 domain-containing protein [Fusobacteriaceae bacterium]|jgi:hypothetical protein|nr:DUF3108 domain-containing protein [Fusobacteriaceae bacterium]